jgi:hypothetical protein
MAACIALKYESRKQPISKTQPYSMPTDIEPASPIQPDKKPRWIRLTPERFIWAVLFLMIFLWFSEQFGWFAFNEKKGLTVLIALAVLGLAILWFALWYVSALLYRRRFQFSIRTLLVLTLAVAISSSWFASEIRRAKRMQKIAESFGAKFNVETWQWIAAPSGLTNLLGEFFFKDVYFFCTTESRYEFSDEEMKQCCEFDRMEFGFFSRSAITDAGLDNIGNLTRLKYLDLRDTAITDAGLKHLGKLRLLETLDLTGTNTTEAGIHELQSKLPHCKISW